MDYKIFVCWVKYNLKTKSQCNNRLLILSNPKLNSDMTDKKLHL